MKCALNMAASCIFPTQELGGSLQGECTDFQAVSGRGLHCVVSGVERYAVREGESSETLTRHLYSSTEVSLVPSNIQDLVGTAHSKKKYQVSLLCPRPLSLILFSFSVTHTPGKYHTKSKYHSVIYIWSTSVVLTSMSSLSFCHIYMVVHA